MQNFAILLALLLLSPIHSVQATGASMDASSVLDVNTASAIELARELPGIGPAKAALIVQWREKHGAFKSINQLQEVKGIGPKTVEKLRPHLRVGSQAAASKRLFEQKDREQRVRTDIRSIVSSARLAAQSGSTTLLPTTVWFRRSALDLLRAH